MKTNSNSKTSKVISIICLIAVVISIASCGTPKCGYMKNYHRDVRMGIAH